eukprot:4068526-Pleurochrysis_carterae.AAC.1
MPVHAGMCMRAFASARARARARARACARACARLRAVRARLRACVRAGKRGACAPECMRDCVQNGRARPRAHACARERARARERACLHRPACVFGRVLAAGGRGVGRVCAIERAAIRAATLGAHALVCAWAAEWTYVFACAFVTFTRNGIMVHSARRVAAQPCVHVRACAGRCVRVRQASRGAPAQQGDAERPAAR